MLFGKLDHFELKRLFGIMIQRIGQSIIILVSPFVTGQDLFASIDDVVMLVFTDD